MLNLFKSYNTKISILDDFQFYETRQKFMQEKRAKQQTHLQQHQVLYAYFLIYNVVILVDFAYSLWQLIYVPAMIHRSSTV